jgi:hypothetical protein
MTWYLHFTSSFGDTLLNPGALSCIVGRQWQCSENLAEKNTGTSASSTAIRPSRLCIEAAAGITQSLPIIDKHGILSNKANPCTLRQVPLKHGAGIDIPRTSTTFAMKPFGQSLNFSSEYVVIVWSPSITRNNTTVSLVLCLRESIIALCYVRV